MVDTPYGEWFFFHFQQYNPLGRVVHLQPMHWKNGWPVIGVDMDMNGIGEPVTVWTKPRTGKQSIITVPQTDDDFSSEKLSLQWQFNHNPENKAWSLTEQKGMLTFHALKASSFKRARNTLTQKTMGYKGTTTTKMIYTELAEGQYCGLACIGKENYLIGIAKQNGKTFLYFEKDGIIKQKETISGEDIYLRLEADAKENNYQFLASQDGKSYKEIGTSFNMKFGNWKGVRIGLYCYNTQSADGKVAFDWFQYEHDGPSIQNKH